MLKLGALELGGVPRLAVPFTHRETREAVAGAAARGAEIAELRIDLFSDPTAGASSWKLERFRGLATIGTIRAASEGGGWKGREAERLELFAALAPHVDALDVELASKELRDGVVALAREQGALAILSHHDFEATPERRALVELADAAREAGADIVKIATTPRDPADLRALAGLCLDRPDTPLIAIGMGAAGLATRLLLPALGSLVTFASLDADSTTAPGQLPLDEMRGWLDRLFPRR